jgi:endonuclease G, mitochondrial
MTGKQFVNLLLILLMLVLIGACTYHLAKQVLPPPETAKNEVKTQGPEEASLAKPADTSIALLELPNIMPDEEVITHTGFALVYSEPHEQARWVAYEITLPELQKVASRTDRFMPDPKIRTGSAEDKDYLRSGYDRGHLAPAADMAWSEEAMRESFYFSNISPQVPAFNRGIWKKLEERVRDWVVTDSALFIVTGPVLRDGLPVIGVNKVSVPEYYFKVILVYRETKQTAIGFLIPNAGSSLPLQNFAVTVDSVQRVTGINFFHQVPDEREAVIEKELCLPCWNWW